MTIKEFINDFKSKKIMNTKIDTDAVSKYLKKELEIKTYKFCHFMTTVAF